MFYAIYIAFTLSMNNLYVLTFAVKNNPDHVSLQMLNISTSVKKKQQVNITHANVNTHSRYHYSRKKKGCHCQVE